MRALGRIAELRDRPCMVVGDSGTELTYALQNAFVENFNGRLRDECLNEHLFHGLGDARRISRAGAPITTRPAPTPASAA